MKTIGVTGGIGSGKSTIARIIHLLGYPVYIADTEASRLMNENPVIRKQLTDRFGTSIYTSDGKLDKPLLASLIFKSPKALSEVNHIVHPVVIQDFQDWCSKQNNSLAFFESAILFEAGLNKYFEYIICVTAPRDLRIQRVKIRDQATTEQIHERMNNQMDDAEKCKRSDFVIHNDNLKPVIRQIQDIIAKIEGKLQREPENLK